MPISCGSCLNVVIAPLFALIFNEMGVFFYHTLMAYKVSGDPKWANKLLKKTPQTDGLMNSATIIKEYVHYFCLLSPMNKKWKEQQFEISGEQRCQVAVFAATSVWVATWKKNQWQGKFELAVRRESGRKWQYRIPCCGENVKWH